MDTNLVRVRFAPSPTGYLHIGGGRTALFNWLEAKARGGKFILRIEDTDKQRSEARYLDEILDSLKWLGMEWDELYHQSERFEIYLDYAKKLLEQGKAYRDGEAIIFKVNPDEKLRFKDLIRGEIEFDSSTIKDQVLIKSDQSPTYNFACVIDDALMNITHIIRGDDHISNTPKQLILYNALRFKVPEFAHLPLILGMGGGRLSKRTGATAISEYRKMGYLPEAVFNYLLLLGWSPGENEEIIDKEEAVRRFNIEKANKTAATFNIDKLDWLNNQYLKSEDPEKLAEIIIPDLIEKGLIAPEGYDREYILGIIRLFQPRLTVLTDFPDWADFFFLKEPKFDAQAEEKLSARDFSREFAMLAEKWAALTPYTIESIEESFRKLVDELGIKVKDLIHPVRAVLTGKTIGPSLFDVVYYLGKDRVKERLSKWVKK